VRADGFHEIDTVMQAVSLSDTIEIDRADGISVSCDDPAVPDGEGNIVHAAASLLREEEGVQSGCSIRIRKRIPAAAGLGGGSSNAAAALAGLSRLWSLDLTRARLIALGGRLGSDVPFFFMGGTVRCRGRGEKMEPLAPIPPSTRFLLVTPRAEISSSFAYKELDRLRLTSGSPSDSMSSVLGLLANSGTWDGSLFNRLEESVLPAYPLVKATIDSLTSQCGSPAIMSGSGSTVFGILGDDLDPEETELLFQCNDNRNTAVVYPVSSGFRLLDSSAP